MSAAAAVVGRFGVHGDATTSGEVTQVIGRCYTGPIRIGDAFRSAQSPGGERVAVALTVVAMDSYGHALDEIQEGLTARLTLRGTGADHLADETVLSTAGSRSLYFSYSQFMVFDRSVELPGCDWTESHVRQGFARREQNVSFSTLDEFGTADLVVHLGPYVSASRHQRVIEVPLQVSSGKVVVCGPEESGAEEHVVSVESGPYRLVAAQALVTEGLEAIDLYLEALTAPITRSRILVADRALQPPDPLLETVEVASP